AGWSDLDRGRVGPNRPLDHAEGPRLRRDRCCRLVRQGGPGAGSAGEAGATQPRIGRDRRQHAPPWVRGGRQVSDVAAMSERALPSVSVLLPAWNEASTLGRCLDSLLAIPWPDLEIILCAGGNDGTVEIAKRYAAAHPDRIVFL